MSTDQTTATTYAGYALTLTADEHRSLAWVADRYQCAAVLYDGLTGEDGEDDTETTTYSIPEHVAWEYAEALPLENGDPGAIVPPCVAGTLADKLVALLESIV